MEAGEVDWEIAPGRKVRGYGFNGQVPGPILEAKQGVPLEIEFTNRLPEPTLIHWHGLRIPAASRVHFSSKIWRSAFGRTT